MPLLPRPYGDADLARVTDLLHARLAAGRPHNLSVAEIRQVLPRPATGTARNGRVWEQAGAVVGFALVWPPSFGVQVLVHPDHEPHAASESGLLDEMVEWCAVRGRPVPCSTRPSAACGSEASASKQRWPGPVPAT